MNWIKPKEEPNANQDVIVCMIVNQRPIKGQQLAGPKRVYRAAIYRNNGLYSIDGKAYMDSELEAWTPIVKFNGWEAVEP